MYKKQCYSKKNQFKNGKKGITLIALVITIIVLLILAAVTINLIMGENGIFGKARKAKEDTLIAQYEERINLIKLEKKAEANGGEVSLDTLKAAYDDSSQSYWVNKTEKKTVSETELIELTTQDGYVFNITGDSTTYSGPGTVETITAAEVEFTPSNSNWKQSNGNSITNVQQALDSLYGN